MPVLSVLVPVRDALPWLRASFTSLWRQTEQRFEVIAVDDGSTDGSGEWLEREARREHRLRVLRGPHCGLPAALNAALAVARAPLVARHDADDLSHRERFALQCRHLAAHPDVDVVGTRVRLFPAHGHGAGMQRWVEWHNALLGHEDMRREALIDSPLAHGCALLRRATLTAAGGWQDHGWAEDLDLWLRLLERRARFAKLPRVLYGWRQHPASATRRDVRYTRERFLALKLAALERTVLARGRRATLIGVGESLERWRVALGSRAADVRVARGPDGALLRSAAPPLLLVYGSRVARARWRECARHANLSESQDFIFIS